MIAKRRETRFRSEKIRPQQRLRDGGIVAGKEQHCNNILTEVGKQKSGINFSHSHDFPKLNYVAFHFKDW